METHISALLDSLSESLASMSAHMRGDNDEWGVRILPTEAGWMAIGLKDRKPFLEVEIAEGAVQLRRVESREETLSYSDSSFDSQSTRRSKPPKRTFYSKYSSPLAHKPEFRQVSGRGTEHLRNPLWKRDLNINLYTEESDTFTDLCTPGVEGCSNIPAQFTGVWKEGTKSWLESEKEFD